MSKFHSMLSRRDFMKVLGVSGAVVGAAALTAPVFHDLDELTASGDMANPRRPWWIKERNFGDPTVEIEWSLVQRYNSLFSSQSNNYLYDPTWGAEVAQQYADKQAWITAKKPGYTIQDFAYRDTVGLPPSASTPWVPLAGQVVNTPQALGVPPYEGDPDYNSRMLRTAMRTFGNFMLAYIPFDKNMERLTYSNGYTFDYNATQGYVSSSGLNVIPRGNVSLTVIPCMAPEMLGPYNTNPSPLVRGIHEQGNRISGQVRSSTQRFLTQLGFQCMNGGFAPIPALYILGGGGEMGRTGSQVMSPSYAMNITASPIITDLPLSPTHPIDAGMWEFCQKCGNCAKHCPSSSISTESEPSWEVPPLAFAKAPYDTSISFSTPGKKVFWNNMSTCKSYEDAVWGCNICMANCVFQKNSASSIHQTVKSIVSTTSAFDTFFKNMDQAFGYGLQQFKAGVGPQQGYNGYFNPNGPDWWTTERPPFGWDGRAETAWAQ